MTDGSLRFTDDFPLPDRAELEARIARDLRGKPYADVCWQQPDGPPIPPVATQQDIAGLPHLDAAPRSWLGAAAAWRTRELVVCSEPATAAEHAQRALADGADEIEFCFDDLALDARDPDAADAPPGVSGIAIHSFAAFGRAIDGIDLGATCVGLSAGEAAIPALAYLVCAADDHGVARDALHGDVDFDPIARLTQRQAGFDASDSDVVVSSCTSKEHVFDECAAVVRWCAEQCPGIRPVALDMQGYHLAGASAAQELGCSIAQVVEVVRQLAGLGLTFADVARAATVRMQTSHEVLIEIAKLRALRLLWAKIAHEFGATDLASLAPRLHCITSGRSRSYRFDTRTNLLRTTLAGFAAITGGCDSLTIVPFDEDPARQDDSARRLARHQQTLLRDESHLEHVLDPGGGSFAIESLTHRIAERAWQHFRRIEGAGGLCAALRDGTLLELVVETAERRTRAFASRERVLVGINRYVDPALEGETSSNEDAAAAAIDRVARSHAAWLEARDGTAAAAATARITDAASRDLVEAACAAARDGATTGELARATWPESEFRHRFPPIALIDGDEFEELRELREEQPATAMIARLSDAAVTTGRASFVRSALRAGGYAIIEPDPFGSIGELAQAIAKSQPLVVALCGEDDAYAAYLASLDAIDSLLVVVGPPAAHLEERGVAFVDEGADIIAVLTALAHGGDGGA